MASREVNNKNMSVQENNENAREVKTDKHTSKLKNN